MHKVGVSREYKIKGGIYQGAYVGIELLGHIVKKNTGTERVTIFFWPIQQTYIFGLLLKWSPPWAYLASQR